MPVEARRIADFLVPMTMAGRIHVLPDALADQIAAGEVVERPASVVKELLENAVDANCASIRVEIARGGTEEIRVSDDGDGMTPEDVALAIKRHATSKIRSAKDLDQILTLGFRGEALPSIASVSHFELTSRPRDAIGGAQIRVDGGRVGPVLEVGCSPGTTLVVADLFYNVPARRKFLKSIGTESAQVAAVCRRAALAYPQLRLSLVRDGRRAFEVLPTETMAERATMIFPKEQLSYIEGERGEIKVEAMLSAPERARSGATGLHLFVNRRPVKDRALARSVAFAYGSVLPPGRYPTGVVYLSVDPREVDVNVHPQKSEVRFAQGRAVLDALTRVLSAGLGRTAWAGPSNRPKSYWQDRLSPKPDDSARQAPRAPTPVTGAPLRRSGPAPIAATHSEDAWGLTPSRGAPERGAPERSAPVPYGERDLGTSRPPFSGTEGQTKRSDHSGALPSSVAEAQAPTPSSTEQHVSQHVAPSPSLLEEVGFFGSLRVIGQAKRMFIVCEDSRGLHLIDQHAADERVRFDQLRRARQGQGVLTQGLLMPERVALNELEAAQIIEFGDTLLALGLDVSVIGERTAAVRAVPALVQRASPEVLLREVLGELSRTGERAFADRVDLALATMACHGAVRGGDALSQEECRALLRALDQVSDFSGHCPHGRPVVHALAFDDLERSLGR